jgi:hypothetical protein
MLRLSELDTIIRQSAGESGKFNFMLALNFLYLTGIIDYNDSTDSIYLLSSAIEIENHETL